MGVGDNVTPSPLRTLSSSPAAAGLLLGSIGVLIFSFSFPATKLALRSFDPWFVSLARAVIAAALAAVTLAVQRARRPRAAEWRRLAVVSGAVVIGFPALSSLALQSSGSAHGAVVIALLPAATAVAGVMRARERPSLGFWFAAVAGAAVVTGYAVERAGGSLRVDDLYLLLGVVICAIGYAEGGVLARSLGASQTICWAVLIALPITLPVAIATAPDHAPSAAAVAGLAYIGAGSMFLGFFAWYGGLARGGVARVSQLQLAQTPLTLVWSALVLDEQIGFVTAAVALAVVLSVAATQRTRIRHHDPVTRVVAAADAHSA